MWGDCMANSAFFLPLKLLNPAIELTKSSISFTRAYSSLSMASKGRRPLAAGEIIAEFNLGGHQYALTADALRTR